MRLAVARPVQLLSRIAPPQARTGSWRLPRRAPFATHVEASSARPRQRVRWARWALGLTALGLPAWKIQTAVAPLFDEGSSGSLRGEAALMSSPSGEQLEDMQVSLPFVLSEASDRLIRDVVTAALMVREYSIEGAAAEPDWHAAHTRAAKRLHRLCAVNRGVYIKLGQHVAMLEYMVPAEYSRAMEPLCHTAPTSHLDDVRVVVEQELGKPLEDVFSSFDPVPIASASLAQVHRAVLRSTGEVVAVKVQHHGLREASHVDLRTISALVDMVKRLYPRFEYSWLVEEIRENLPKELNFRLEAANMRRTGEYLRGRSNVTVPSVIDGASTSRVLTMSFEEGCYVNNRAQIEQMGLDPSEVASIVAEVFNEQIFVHGFVHCDPHAGNVLVRPSTVDPSRAHVVLLDHGLYKELSPWLRHEYAKLWRALIFGDESAIRASATSMNVGEQYPLFAAMVTSKPWEDVLDPNLDSLRIDRSSEGRKRTGDYAKQYMDDINTLLLRVPRDLLLLLKTADCLRSVDASLGGKVDTFHITAKSCLRRINAERPKTLSNTLASWYDWAHMELNFSLFHWWQWWEGRS
jgi:aarF domain-containing kinase